MNAKPIPFFKFGEYVPLVTEPTFYPFNSILHGGLAIPVSVIKPILLTFASFYLYGSASLPINAADSLYLPVSFYNNYKLWIIHLAFLQSTLI